MLTAAFNAKMKLASLEEMTDVALVNQLFRLVKRTRSAWLDWTVNPDRIRATQAELVRRIEQGNRSVRARRWGYSHSQPTPTELHDSALVGKCVARFLEEPETAAARALRSELLHRLGM
ncbi:hypothetical protein [Xanthomonas perforans]|uniref:hypothetical protein n=1 Tax=Xanthomonas perforans TaxID=442694 RepID=UPI002358DC1E|nr:hypothetical protein [Xanthomonas perforans]MDC9654388.1 hypothetical protein [Xanthomonas perforans]MEB2159629.1 hypothetical protein [Xanthomonas campestris pv. campestris]